MIQKIKSKRLELPPIYLVETKEDFKELPAGIPYIIGTVAELPFIILYLEFQVLYRSCKATGIPIRWEDCLRRLGYSNSLRSYNLSSGGEYDAPESSERFIDMNTYIEDQYLVDFDVLCNLKILPNWLEDLKSSVEANIIDEVMFDPTSFNKKLGLNIGYSTVSHQKKNLLILDVSGSIPVGVVKAITALAKLMSKRFYADVMITSGKTTLVAYEEVADTDFVKMARDSGSGNEGQMYKAIVEEYKEYNTCISFGDNDSPASYGMTGELVPKFRINTLYSLHTTSETQITGYCKHYKPDVVHKVSNLVKTLES